MSHLSAFHALQARTLAAVKNVEVLTPAAAVARRHLLMIAAVGVGMAAVLPSIPAMVAADRAAAAEMEVPSVMLSYSVLKLEQAVANIYSSVPNAPRVADLDDANDAVSGVKSDITEALDTNPAAAAVMAERVIHLATSDLGARAALHGVEFGLALPVAAMRASTDARVMAVASKLDTVPPVHSAPPLRRRMGG